MLPNYQQLIRPFLEKVNEAKVREVKLRDEQILHSNKIDEKFFES
jgi:hypothetical protein